MKKMNEMEILEKILEINKLRKSNIFFFCVNKMVEISADTWAKM